MSKMREGTETIRLSSFFFVYRGTPPELPWKQKDRPGFWVSARTVIHIDIFGYLTAMAEGSDNYLVLKRI